MTPLKCLFVLLTGITAQLAANDSQLQFHDLTFPSQINIVGYNSLSAMATLLEHNGWHSGERAIHSLLKVPTSGRQNPTAPGLPPSYAHRVTVSHLLAVGTVDDQGRPWTSIWGGERGFAQPVAQNILGIQSLVDKTHDPVVQALLGKATKGEVLRPENGRTMSALSIDLDSRDRVKVAGKMAVGTVAGRPDNDTIGEVQIAMAIQESLGNCPKYLNKKAIRAHIPSPELVSSSLPLPPDALALIEKADMFFLSSTNGQTMDTNHRGGPAGFVRVVSNSPTDVVLAYPEFSGNRLYQTLGNLHTNPLIGIAIPDYSTSDVLYLTGSTQLLVGAAAASLMPHTNLAVKITVDSARFIKDGLPVRGTPLEPSPYNPPVRRLASQSPLSLSSSLQTSSQQQSPLATATLLRRDLLTPTIARFTFLLRPPSSSSNNQPLKTWQPGQHITLSFASELDMGYSHMREADPQSLNDDFVRTFTISSPPPPPPPPPPVSSSSGSVSGSGSGSGDGVEIQLTLRKHGPVTGLLFSQPIGAAAGVLEVPVLGVGGEEGFRIVAASAGSKKKKKAVFVAGGIGITPLLAQAPGVLLAAAAQAAAAAQSGKDVKEGGVEVLWSLRAEDLPLAVDAFERVEGLGSATRIFVTRGSGDGHEDGDVVAVIERVRALGAKVEVRRMGKEDLLGVRDAVRGTKYFACASPGMIRSVQDWFGEEEVVFESFEY